MVFYSWQKLPTLDWRDWKSQTQTRSESVTNNGLIQLRFRRLCGISIRAGPGNVVPRPVRRGSIMYLLLSPLGVRSPNSHPVALRGDRISYRNCINTHRTGQCC